MTKIDTIVQNYFLEIRSESLTPFFYAVTSIYDFSLYFAVLVFLLLLLIYIKMGWRESALFLFAVFSAIVVSYVLKNLFDAVRPVGGVYEETGHSFPSYHATQATVFFLIITYIFRNELGRVWGSTLTLFSFVMIFLVAVSRLYLGVHWLSDVLAGILSGCLIVYLLVKLFRYVTNSHT